MAQWGHLPPEIKRVIGVKGGPAALGKISQLSKADNRAVKVPLQQAKVLNDQIKKKKAEIEAFKRAKDPANAATLAQLLRTYPFLRKLHTELRALEKKAQGGT